VPLCIAARASSRRAQAGMGTKYKYGSAREKLKLRPIEHTIAYTSGCPTKP